MTSLLCPDQRFKPLPRIVSHDSAFLVLTQFLSPEPHILHIDWVCKPERLCDIVLLSPDGHTEEPKFSFLSLPWILKRVAGHSFRYRVRRLAIHASVSDASWTSPGRCPRHVPPRGGPGHGVGHAGGAVSLSWPGNTLSCPQRS
ncbi:hypothetical protein ILYODFUR_014412 [Ilyodon furcidens]|uniref:Uncharacterized protein n=1 Tax=Ilyodon furcidens TaxID=33524 RepID=A0ABV0VE94_9TELE